MTDGESLDGGTHVDADDGLWIPPRLREFTGQVVFRTPRATIQHFAPHDDGLDPYYGLVDESHFGNAEAMRDPLNPELAPRSVSIKPAGEDLVELNVSLPEEQLADGSGRGEHVDPPTIYDVAELPDSQNYKGCRLWPDGESRCDQPAEYVFVYAASQRDDDDQRRNAVVCEDCCPRVSPKYREDTQVRADGSGDTQATVASSIMAPELDALREAFLHGDLVDVVAEHEGATRTLVFDAPRGYVGVSIGIAPADGDLHLSVSPWTQEPHHELDELVWQRADDFETHGDDTHHAVAGAFYCRVQDARFEPGEAEANDDCCPWCGTEVTSLVE